MSDPTMPEMFDRLTDQVGQWSLLQPGTGDYTLSSDRELTDSDDTGLITVTMKDFKVASVHVDEFLWDSPDLTPESLGAATTQAINKVLTKYLAEEVLAAQSAALPMSEVHDGLKRLSAEFSTAYANAMGRLREARP